MYMKLNLHIGFYCVRVVATSTEGTEELTGAAKKCAGPVVNGNDA